MSFLGFESAESTFDELAPEEFFARFPEGHYKIVGRSLEDAHQKSTVSITHVLPAPPHFVHPPLASCDDPVVVTAPVTIDWAEVVTHHPHLGVAGPVEIARYELAFQHLDLEITGF